MNQINEIASIKKLADNVDGWLEKGEGELLYTLAKKCTGKGVIVEIGSWKGKSTIWLGSGSRAGNRIKVYAVDPFTGSSEHKKMYGEVWTFGDFKNNIQRANLSDMVIPIVNTSEAASKNWKIPIDLLFIDGAHEYESVKNDFLMWSPYLNENGVVAFHDTREGDPGVFVKNCIFRSKNYKVRFYKSITFAIKTRNNSFTNWMNNTFFLFLKCVRDFISKTKVPIHIK